MAVNQRRRFIDESDRAEGFEPSESDVQSSFGFESSSEPAPASALGEDESASGDFAEEGREKRVVVRPKAKRTAVRSKTAVRTTGAGRRSPVSENAAFSPRSEEPFSDAANQSAHNGALIQQNGQSFDAENDAQSRDAKPRLSINDLTKMSMPGLRDLAAQYGIPRDDLAPMKKQELIFVILKSHTEHGGIIFASGALEILPDGYGFLRSPQNSYLSGPDDIYISPSQIRLFNLKTGDTVYGQIRSPKEGERFFALLRIETVNDDETRAARKRGSRLKI